MFGRKTKQLDDGDGPLASTAFVLPKSKWIEENDGVTRMNMVDLKRDILLSLWKLSRIDLFPLVEFVSEKFES